MGEMQIWQSDKLGTDTESLQKVLRSYREEGTKSLKSEEALKEYLDKLNGNELLDIYTMDADTAILLLADCYGVQKAFDALLDLTGLRQKNQSEEIALLKAENKELQDMLVHYKADLYDFYAQAGVIPDYERGKA